MNSTERKKNNITKPRLFLSYNHYDTVFADIIEQQIRRNTNDKIQISRYKTGVKYKDSFKSFMNSIEEHDFVLCIVSDYYLKSRACMYEVGEVIKNHNYRKKLLFIVLSDNDYKAYTDKGNNRGATDIYDVLGRIKYTKYWQGEYEKLEKEIIGLDIEAKEQQIGVLKEVGNIYRNDIGVFTNFLSESKGISFSESFDNGFTDIIKWMIPDWDSRFFSECNDYNILLHTAITEIVKITHTDYNQIALTAVTGNYQSGLVVFADNIGGAKQRYRNVAVGGLMFKAASTGEILYAKDVQAVEDYFEAVIETKSELIVPIKINGNPVGVINSEAEVENYYSDSMIERIKTIADRLAVSLIKLGYSSNIQSDVIPYIHIR
ncbi:MAG: TIR domain-containing protein [Bacteroidales bacterium]|nr:TIR domain-containing protein [Bacteroidales bacterium]